MAESLFWLLRSNQSNGHDRPPTMAPVSSSADAVKSQTVSRLSDDPRIFAMSCASLGGGCLWILVPIALALVGAFLRSREVNPDGWFTAALIALPTLLALWLIVHFGFPIRLLSRCGEGSGRNAAG